MDKIAGSGKTINMAIGVEGDDKKAWSVHGESGFNTFLNDEVTKKDEVSPITMDDIVKSKGKLAVREGRTVYTSIDKNDAAKKGFFGHPYLKVN